MDDNSVGSHRHLSRRSLIATQVAANNRIRGGVAGDQAAATTNRSARAAAVPDREDAGDQRAETRRTVAVQEATAAGDARL
ncbi:hypothetical protein [Micromonospora sp. NPDC000668]|uniref:hypothetical protein n=1 Tax=Micromonospora sp. NPDC000668 TaxID=3364219 RepID=UPI0036A19C81